MSHHRFRRTVAAAACALTLAAVGVPLASSPAGAEPVTDCPAAAGNARFVRWMYLQILNRCPEDGAVEFWTAKLDAGTSRYSVAESIDMSRENVIANNVVPLFDVLLNRAPTDQEKQIWGDHIRRYHEDGIFSASLLSDPEYYDAVAGPSVAERDANWLGDVFDWALDRAPDDTGADYFGAMLGSPSSAESRFTVASKLEQSTENARDWTIAVYGAGLHRDPDAAGLRYWVNWLTRGSGKWHTFQLWTTFLSSQESYRIAQQQISFGAPSSSAAGGLLGRLQRAKG